MTSVKTLTGVTPRRNHDSFARTPAPQLHRHIFPRAQRVYNTHRCMRSAIEASVPSWTSRLLANCSMQPSAGSAREDGAPNSSSTPKYGPIYTPPGGQAQAAQQQSSQQQQTRRRDGPAPIAPAPEGFSRSGTSSASAMTPSGIAASREIPARPKRKLINLACTACQKRKSKVRF